QEDLERAVERVGAGWHGIARLVALGSKPAAPAELSRRSFLQLAGGGAAAVGLAACSSRPSREILPYANQPPELTPGVPQHYATALVEDGFATGVLVAASEGRPTKIEGNPDHPASLGGTRAIEQAAVLQLFDPERARAITDHGAPAAWTAIEAILDDAAAARGEGLHLVLEPTTSPMVIELLGRVRAALPAAKVAFWSPFSPRASLDGNRLAFGEPLQTQCDLRAANVVVALDADLAATHPMAPAYARQLADGRRVVTARSAMSRLYVAEPGYTATGVIADHRLAVRGSQIERVARELFAAVLGQSAMRGAATELPSAARARLASAPAAAERAPWIAAAAADLAAAAGHSIVVAGERQPPVVHAIAAALNAVLGNRAVSYTDPVVFEAGQPSHDLAAVARAIDGGQVKTLLVCGGNPAYTAPAGLALARALRKVERSVYLGLYANETARACRFAVPTLHELEQWGAARGFDGTLTPIQPLIEPLFAGRTVTDVLHRLLGDPARPARDRFVDAWHRLVPDAPLELALRRGCVAGSAAPARAVEVAWGALAPVIAAAGSREPARL
ncbi:MAG TPA: twin-arginine translocation signal domain-containing protein, partial [Kofleriaceae bacterium]